MSTQTAADLRAAADILERDGWTQGTWRDATGCRCAGGAITVALLPLEDDEFDRRYEAAINAVSSGVSQPIITWNDSPGRTAPEVIATLRAIAWAIADRTEAEL